MFSNGGAGVKGSGVAEEGVEGWAISLPVRVEVLPGWAKALAQNSPAKVPSRMPPEPHLKSIPESGSFPAGVSQQAGRSESGLRALRREVGATLQSGDKSADLGRLPATEECV